MTEGHCSAPLAWQLLVTVRLQGGWPPCPSSLTLCLPRSSLHRWYGCGGGKGEARAFATACMAHSRHPKSCHSLTLYMHVHMHAPIHHVVLQLPAVTDQ